MPRVEINCLFYILLLAGSTFAWVYNDQRNWAKFCKDGKKQSPIALVKDVASEVFYTPFIWDNYVTNVVADIRNNGHSAEARLQIPLEERPEVKGGNLPNVYVLDHLHFHWQSEHTMDEYRFPLELHMVHYAKQYGNLTSALRVPQGVAVFGVLFDFSPDDDATFQPILSIVETVKDHHEAQSLPNFNVQNFLPRDTAGYYRYEGSLTTPDCNEGILWTVFTNTIPISKSQVKIFEGIHTRDMKPLHKNYRTLQDLNGRQIFLKVSPLRSTAATSLPSVFKLASLSLLVYLLNFNKSLLSH